MLSETKSCKSSSVCQWLWQTSVSPLYGVLTKTLHTAQAHFGVWHASAKHKNKLTENTKTALYPRGPFERNENQRNPEFPLFHSAFYGRSLEEDQGNNTVCLSVWPLSYLSSTSTDYGRDTKMRDDQVCRLFLGVQSSANSCRRGLKSLNPWDSGTNSRRRYFVPLGPSVVAFVL